MALEKTILEKAKAWTQPPFDGETAREIQELLDNNAEKEIYDRFYTDLEFGTGGLRGIMGAGLNRMNIYTAGRATQGLANYIGKQNLPGTPSVVVAHDSRLNSETFAKDTACILAAAGIKTYLFDGLRPTPELSFAVRYLKTTAGVMLTASHNPKEYNGYKAYWSDGAQVVPPHDKGIIGEVLAINDMNAIQRMDFDEATEKGLVEIVGKEVDEAFLKEVLALSIQPEICREIGRDMKLVYTPLHGTGIVMVPEALKRWGFEKVVLCEAQKTPDGTFPNAPFPNPEDPEAMEAAIATARQEDAELVLATDPDADRVGIAVRDGEEYSLVTGNQIVALLVDYVLGSKAASGTMPPDPRVITTIVTSTLVQAIAESYEVPVDITLTGFKWIGEKIREYEESGKGQYLVGGEESYGYLVGTHARDKDAVVSACFIAEMLADSRSRGETLLQRLDGIFRKHGVYQDSQISMKFPGAEGKAQIGKIMDGFRGKLPESFAGLKTVRVVDVQKDEVLDVQDGKISGKTGLPQSNVLVFELEDGSRVMARPSGTEPKIKFYFGVCDRADLPIAPEELAERKTGLSKRHEALRQDLQDKVQAFTG